MATTNHHQCQQRTPHESPAQSNSVTVDDDDDEFQDASDDVYRGVSDFEMDLATALDEAKLAINYFFNNKFVEARNLMKPWANSSIYHSIGNCVFSFLEAILTFEQEHIIDASKALKLCLTVCNRHRKKSTLTESIGKPFKKPNYEQYTELEAHAELCSAEALLLKAMLTFIEDETLTSLLSGGIKIRTCFNSYNIKLEWREATLFATYLVENSKWSRTIYTYQKACILLMIGNGLTGTELKTIEDLMREAPRYKQRIAGKSLPMEKFTCKKTERYFSQNKQLCLPIIELMYLWNSFKIIGKNFQLADSILKLIETELQQLNIKMDGDKYDVDNRALILLLKGACLRQMNSPLLALKCLETVASLQKDIKEDFYLVPYAIVEIGLLYIDQGKMENAIAALEDAKKNYTGYSLESRLHFRIHTALTDLKATASTKK